MHNLHSKEIEANSRVIRKCHAHLHVLASVYTFIPVIHSWGQFLQIEMTQTQNMKTQAWMNGNIKHTHTDTDVPYFLFHSFQVEKWSDVSPVLKDKCVHKLETSNIIILYGYCVGQHFSSAD